MTVSFNDLKRSSANSITELTKEMTKLQAGSQQERTNDDRFWSCALDKAGNGYAVIRFLPAPQGEDVPFVRRWSHGFKGPSGKWYIENSLTTLGKPDPVADMNTTLWNMGEGSTGRKIVQGSGKDNPGTKRQLSYFSNIYVVSDPKNPENEGKVFIFKYGPKIFAKINDVMNPQYEDETPINPFDFWKGANFKVKIRRVDGYANFDKSEFEAPSQLASDEKMETIWKNQYSLQDLVSAKNFKTYEQLQQKLISIGMTGVGESSSQKSQPQASMSNYIDEGDVAPAPQFKSRPAPTSKAPVADDDDEDFAFFKRLADED